MEDGITNELLRASKNQEMFWKLLSVGECFSECELG